MRLARYSSVISSDDSIRSPRVILSRQASGRLMGLPSSRDCQRTVRAPAVPAQLVRVVACAVRGPSPSNRSAPQAGGGLEGGRRPPPRKLMLLMIRHPRVGLALARRGEGGGACRRAIPADTLA